MTCPTISIIIPAYHCEKTIAETLRCVLASSADWRAQGGTLSSGGEREAEVIVVDDGSTDETKVAVQAFPSVKYIFQDNAGPAAARNRGAAEAQGGILFFTDSDCLPRRDWVRKIMARFEDPAVAVVAGSYGIANPHSILARCIHQEILFRHHRLMPEYPSYFGSFNFAVRRSVFASVGGFNTQYRQASGEDNDLSYKIAAAGHRIYFAKDALVDHHHTERPGTYLREQYRHGFWRVRMYLDHPGMSRGDGYTFWKDIVEIQAVLVFYVWLFGSLAGIVPFYPWGAVVGAGLIAMEIYFGIAMAGSFRERVYLSLVMAARALARTSGFVCGVWYFIFSPRRRRG